ncbi:hypothetical protein [Plantactinospora sp. GCM10030261]|uniref:hypothetical protein n=1 Tax=Plantactinospora sp. GCM10030261 TaxID=3273420 RepID=UPI00362366F8
MGVRLFGGGGGAPADDQVPGGGPGGYDWSAAPYSEGWRYSGGRPYPPAPDWPYPAAGSPYRGSAD